MVSPTQLRLGKDPNKLAPFIKEYGESPIKGFVDGIKKDMDPSRMRYPIMQVVDLLKETITNPYRRMVKALATSNVAPNLLNREFETQGHLKVLLTDITYIINSKVPRCYMSTIIDACTKKLLSWQLSTCLENDFVLEAVNQLIEEHGVLLTSETLIHSDQGSHYIH